MVVPFLFYIHLMHPSSNRLIHESSPYLLQHAHNPVDWYSWGEEALNRALAEDKPILVSIGYAACHWCHVMERESFENEAVAVFMNDHFINIKIDREERPDIDHLYMDAVQAMTGSGGWPLNVFLTPDKKPFYGGTYFPPVRAFNRPSWMEILQGVSQAYKERKEEILSQADRLTEHLINANAFGQNVTTKNNPAEEVFAESQLHLIYENLMKNADKAEGGFGRAPKFPQTFSIAWLLQYYHFFKKEAALQQACLSLDKMIYGGIYDQLGGGLARYSTDNEWLVPHFEKMLYDNALLLSVLSDAFLITRNPAYERVIHHIITFIKRELYSEEGLFLSALDADSEGEEGKFYVWSKNEIADVLGTDAALFCSVYDVSDNGNWESKNILRLKISVSEFAAQQGWEEAVLEEKLETCRNLLLKERNKRIRPLTDDKILLSWNALMITALTKAFAATGSETYRELAVKAMNALLKSFDDGEGGLLHSFTKGVAKYPAFLDDYAFLIQALIYLQEITSDISWLNKAAEYLSFVKAQFEEETTGYFFFTSATQTDVVVRKKEIYDGAIPSGNAIMQFNLAYLAVIFDKPEWMEQARQNLASMAGMVTRYPGSFGVWAACLTDQIIGINEIAIMGNGFSLQRDALLNVYLPNKILQAAREGLADFPLLAGKATAAETQLYLCRNYTCQQPVNTVSSLLELIAKTQPLKHNK